MRVEAGHVEEDSCKLINIMHIFFVHFNLDDCNCGLSSRSVSSEDYERKCTGCLIAQHVHVPSYPAACTTAGGGQLFVAQPGQLQVRILLILHTCDERVELCASSLRTSPAPHPQCVVYAVSTARLKQLSTATRPRAFASARLKPPLCACPAWQKGT